VIRDREFGFLREILVSPMPHSLILFGKTQGGATVAMMHGSLVLALGRFADVSLAPRPDILYGLGLMFPLCFAVTSFGVIIANHIRSFEGFVVFANAVILSLYFTSSSVFPLDPALTHAQALVVYPEWLGFLVENNPLTYAVDALGGAFIHFHQSPPSMGPAIIAAMAVGFFLVAPYSFGRPRT
jgi:ABC-2 type transport system permease protein